MSAEAEAELNLLLTRMDLKRPGRSARRCWGVSSDALAVGSIRRQPPRRRDYPSDPSDLAACERTYRMAPPHLRPFMALVMVRYRAHVEQRYPGCTVRVRDHIDAERDGPPLPPTGNMPPIVAVDGSFTAEQVADLAARFATWGRP